MSNNIRSCIESLGHYMFTENHIMSLSLKTISKNIIQKEEKFNAKKISNDSDIFIPNESDKLFWCYYIILNGLSNYEMLFNSKFKVEKEEKINLISKIRENNTLLKQYKWKRTVVEADLAYSKKISLNTFFCICAVSGINIGALKNNCLYMVIENTGKDIHIVELTDIGYGYRSDDETERLDTFNKYCDKYWQIENINKPLASISSYKINALKNICEKLKISVMNNDGKKLRKIELYNLIKATIIN